MVASRSKMAAHRVVIAAVAQAVSELQVRWKSIVIPSKNGLLIEF